jgi:hypothetical protein
MKIISKRTIALALLLITFGSLAAYSQQAKKEIRVWVFGSGTATEPDRAAADSEAFDAASTQANAICTGKIDSNYIKTSDVCLKQGSDDDTQYFCAVSVKAQCLLGR